MAERMEVFVCSYGSLVRWRPPPLLRPELRYSRLTNGLGDGLMVPKFRDASTEALASELFLVHRIARLVCLPNGTMELLNEFPGEDGLHKFKDRWLEVHSEGYG